MKKITALLVLAASGSVAMADDFTGAGFSIPDNDPAGAASAIVVVSSITSITGITVTLNGFTHTWIGDVTATLSNSSGTFTLFNRPGYTGTGFGNSNDPSGDYTFSDSAAGALSPTGLVPAGSYRTAASDDVTLTSLMGFYGGMNPNDTWLLRLTDGAGGDVGGITGWTLSIVPTPGAAAVLGLGGLAAFRRRRA